MKAAIELGVAMAEAEAIWQLREKARRSAAATQLLSPMEASGDPAARITAELNALRDMREQPADKIERLVRQSARAAEAEQRMFGPDGELSSDQAGGEFGKDASAKPPNKTPRSG